MYITILNNKEAIGVNYLGLSNIGVTDHIYCDLLPPPSAPTHCDLRSVLATPSPLKNLAKVMDQLHIFGLLLVHLLLNFPRDTGHIEAFKCYISGETLNIVGYYFVNNSTIIQVTPSPKSYTT